LTMGQAIMLYHGDQFGFRPTKTLKEALARRDADKWREAITNKIMNFLKQNT